MPVGELISSSIPYLCNGNNHDPYCLYIIKGFEKGNLGYQEYKDDKKKQLNQSIATTQNKKIYSIFIPILFLLCVIIMLVTNHKEEKQPL